MPIRMPVPNRSPEDIRPIPVRNIPRPPSCHSTDVPPDGWIPSADTNSFISIPPPHELSNPVPTPHTPRMPLPSDGYFVRDHPAVHTRDYAYAHQTPARRPRTRTVSTASRGSTRISEYELVSPPRNPRVDHPDRSDTRTPRTVRSVIDDEGSGSGRRGGDFLSIHERSETPGLESRGGTRPERMAEEWRSANPDVVTPPRASVFNDVR